MPAPLPPRMASSSPRRTVRLMPRSTSGRSRSYRIQTSRTSTTGSPEGASPSSGTAEGSRGRRWDRSSSHRRPWPTVTGQGAPPPTPATPAWGRGPKAPGRSDQGRSHLLRRTPIQHSPAGQHRRPPGQGKHLLQPVLREDHGGAQLPVHPAQRLQELARGDRVQLGGGLVQHQHLRPHHQHRRQAQQLALAAGRGRRCPGGTSPGCRKRRPSPPPGPGSPRLGQPRDSSPRASSCQTLSVAHWRSGCWPTKPMAPQRRGDPGTPGAPPEEDGAAAAAMGSHGGLEKPQQGGLSASAGAAEGQKLPPLHRQRHLREGRAGLAGVVKGQILDLERLHSQASFPSKISGRAHTAP